jgi:hypothetical protein
MEALSDLLGFLAGIPAIVGLMLAAGLIFLSSNWRVSLAALLVLYVSVGAVLSRSVVAELVIVRILVGVLVVPILYISAEYARGRQGSGREGRDGSEVLGLRLGWSAGPLGLPVRVLVVLAIALAVFRFYGQFGLLMPVFESGAPALSPDVVLVAVWLMVVGLVGLVVSADPLRVALALLSVLSGFDLVYAHLDSRLAVAGAYGALTLLVALAFSYLALGRVSEEASNSEARAEQGDVERTDAAVSLVEEAADQ